MCMSAPGVFSVKSEASGEADSYTVLVLESSKFLSTIGRQQLYSSAKWICSGLLGTSETNKIAILKYNETNISTSFTDNYNTLDSEINSIKFSGMPNITSALENANSLLKNVPVSSKKNIILLSCGMPRKDPEADDGPYTGKNMCGSHTCIFNEEANSVYNLAETYKPFYNIYSVFCDGKKEFFCSPWLCEEGRIRLLTDISNGGFYNANCDNLELMLMQLTDCVTERTPKGYNFLEDSYKFINNQTPNLSKKYFTTIFESGTADIMYKKHHKTDGLCYGIAHTTAAIYNGLPDVSRFSYLDGWTPKQATKIRDLSRSSALGSKVVVGGNYDDFLELSDYIKYAHIYQYSTEMADLIKESSHNYNPLNIWSMVKEWTDNNRIGVCITFLGSKDALHDNIAGNHTVLAIGYDGNDILIDNPNNTKDYERITIHSDGSWESGRYNSDDHVLVSSTLTYRPYQILLTGNKVVGSDMIGSGSSEHYVEGVGRLDADYTLVSIDAETFNINSNDYVEVTDISGEAETNDENNAKLFWIKDSKTIKIDGLTDDVNTIEYGGDDTVISAVVSADSTVELTIDGDTKTAAVNTKKDEINTLTFSVVDDDGNKKGVEVSGTASGDLVTAKKTETGITVDGLNDMTITYLKDEEEVSDKKAEVKDGREVNITVDDNEETVDTDFVPDSAKCKYCGKVHGDSFIEVIVRFFHKICYFFARIFGKM